MPEFINAKTGQPCITGIEASSASALIARLEVLADRIEELLAALEDELPTEEDISDDSEQEDPQDS